MGEVGTQMGTLERGGDQEKERAFERRKRRSVVANRKREFVQQQHCTFVQQSLLPSFFSGAILIF
jgi:hypothetical protein